MTRGPTFNPFRNADVVIPNQEERPDESAPDFLDTTDGWPSDWGVATKETPELVETSFDSSALTGDPFDDAWAWKQDDQQDVNTTQNNTTSLADQAQNSHIAMTIDERLSVHFDDLSSDPTCKVIGFIFVESSNSSQANDLQWTVRDRKANVERWETAGCENVTAAFPHLPTLEPGDQVFQIKGQTSNSDTPVVAYSCLPKLRPIPLLLKTKFQTNRNSCRVGIRIRANPSNASPLTRIAVVVVIPPDIDSDQVTLSPPGGYWDVLQRTISWPVNDLAAGGCVDLQAHFTDTRIAPTAHLKFPVLVKCNTETLFSRLDVTETTSSSSSSTKPQLTKKARIVYRKV